MSAPKKLKFSFIDQWQEVGYFSKILPYKKGSILDVDLPKKVIIEDSNSSNEYACELIEVISFNESIPSVLSLLAMKKSSQEAEIEIFEKYLDKKISDFAFYFYRINSKIQSND